MRQLLLAPHVIAIALTLLAGRAEATSCLCGSDADCPTGFACDSPMAVECVLPDCSSQPACDPVVVYKGCRTPECADDSECAPEMTCYERSSQDCKTTSPFPQCQPDGGGCLPPPPIMTACMTVTTRQCIPRYLTACSRDADCGKEFTCGDQADQRGRCVAPQIACTTSADCPERWACVPKYDTSMVSCRAVDRPDGGGPFGLCSLTSVHQGPMHCAPPYFNANVGFGVSGDWTSIGPLGPLLFDSVEKAPSATPTAPSSSATETSGGCRMAASHASDATQFLWVVAAFGVVLRRPAVRRGAKMDRHPAG